MMRFLRSARIASLSFALLTLSTAATMADDPQIRSHSPPYPTFGTIERQDPALDALLPPDAKLETLAEGFSWTEGPVWFKIGDYLLFSDIPRNSIYKWKEGQGITLYMKPSGYTGVVDYGAEPGTNGLTVDSEGRLTSCDHGDRRIAVLTKGGGKRTLVDNYQCKRLNSPNDLCFKSNGDLYFTDPIYGLPKRENDPMRELDFCGVYRWHQSIKYIGDMTQGVTRKDDMELTLLTKDMSRPNGIAFSPDEKTLYVSDSDKQHWMAFDVQPDGSLANGRVFFDAAPWAKARKPGACDGMKIDNGGNLFATGPGGLYVFSPDGKHLGTINTGDRTSNCAWGNDGSTLYITVNHRLTRIKTSTKGAGW